MAALGLRVTWGAHAGSPYQPLSVVPKASLGNFSSSRRDNVTAEQQRSRSSRCPGPRGSQASTHGAHSPHPRGWMGGHRTCAHTLLLLWQLGGLNSLPPAYSTSGSLWPRQAAVTPGGRSLPVLALTSHDFTASPAALSLAYLTTALRLDYCA